VLVGYGRQGACVKERLPLGYHYDAEKKRKYSIGYKKRDEPSNDVSEWLGVTVEGGRVTRLYWNDQGLWATILAEIGALSALRFLYLHGNELSGPIPPRIGALTNLTSLHLDCNPLSGVVPSTLSTLSNLEVLSLDETALTNRPDTIVHQKPAIQNYLLSLWGPQAFRFLKYGIAITKKRQDALAPTTSTSPFLIFLTRCEDAMDHILSFLDPVKYGVSSRG
jgi:hypothetical protein